mmetsp:Transcript_4019/g.10605  ORF Transcript_4019/g.10605 Transcript_4019/m.10605 type:complete len:170 (-) Transcript_4019:546-1055(-)
MVGSDEIMQHVDRVASRVSLMCVAGLVAGATGAAVAGYPRRATALKVAMSLGMVSTSVLVLERIAYVGLAPMMPNEEKRRFRTSHAFGGVFGGAVNGYLYQRRPMRGIVLFAPLMLAVSQMEIMYDEQRNRRIQQIISEQQQEQQQNRQHQEHERQQGDSEEDGEAQKQ